MNLDFDIDSVKLIEFGVGTENGGGQTFYAVPVDASVQAALRKMTQATWKAMQKEEGGPTRYEPSEKHGSIEYLFLPLADDWASSMRALHTASNLSIDASILDEPADVFCYFARLTDKKGRRLTALRRAMQFKGVLKSPLLRLFSDTLTLIEDRVFKLDSDFDLLVDSTNVLILHPSAFEFAGKLQGAILDAVPENAQAIQKEITFVEFSSIQEYAVTHPRAARYLASIRGQEEMKNIDKGALKKLCKSTGVEITESKGIIGVPAGQEMGFLEVLDRRRYELELVKGKRERFRAASRKKIDG
ncbi:MAG: Kiwa anti-phage protein KwaB-like domain-containing protein [Planctomycetota bacterium]|jgi:hypothetical protein